jgi:hypothetical protein
MNREWLLAVDRAQTIGASVAAADDQDSLTCGKAGRRISMAALILLREESIA